ncbi:MAG TPA: histidine kinase [Arachnia sp.]|nr:histidine kinase [Arachnia sp.]
MLAVLLYAVLPQIPVWMRGEVGAVETALFWTAVAGYLWLLAGRNVWLCSTLLVLLPLLLPILSDVPSTTAIDILLIAVVVDANSRRPAWAGVALALGHAGVTYIELGRPEIETYWIYPLQLFLVSLFGAFLRQRTEAQRANEVIRQQQHRLAVAEYAQDMHDSVAAHLTQALGLARTGKLTLDGEARQLLGAVEAEAAAAMTSLRQLAGRMRGGAPDAVRAVTWEDVHGALAAGVLTLRYLGFDVSAYADLPEWDDPTAAATMMTGINQAVANICEHGARRGSVLMTLRAIDGMVRLSVSNSVDEDLAPVCSGRGTGLASLREQAEELGGAVRVTREPDAFLLELDLPRPEAR